jgi:hypothetical protein
MGEDREPGASLPIACALTSQELEARREMLLPGLLARAGAREAVAGGFRWRFRPDDTLLRDAAAVIEVERRCCPFLRFQLVVEPGGGPVWLEVTGPEGTRDFLSTLVDPAEVGPGAGAE